MFRERAKQFGVILATWTFMGVFYGWEIYLFKVHAHQPIPLRLSVIRALPDFWIFAALTPAVLWFNSRFRFRRERWVLFVGVHLSATVTFLTLWTTLKVALYPVADLLAGTASPRTWSLFRMLWIDNAHDAFWFYGTIVAVSELLHFQRKCRERETRAAILEFQLSRAQLTALKMQLDPHFLFNTLHSVSSLMHEDAAAADKTVNRLSDLLRMSLENGDDQEVTLRREMEFLDGYLDIQKTRLRDRLTVRLHLDPRTLDAMVPNMILQPLVENAVKHGIAARTTPGNLDIRAEDRGEVLRLEIIDDGPGLSVARANEPTKGIGLVNTRARLQQLYGGIHQFSLNTPPGGGMQVRLDIPFRQHGATTQNERLHGN